MLPLRQIRLGSVISEREGRRMCDNAALMAVLV